MLLFWYKGHMTSLLYMSCDAIGVFGYDVIVNHICGMMVAKCRVTKHDLEIERGRYTKVYVSKRICKLCLCLNEMKLKINIMFFSIVHFMNTSEKYCPVTSAISLICIVSSIVCVLTIR